MKYYLTFALLVIGVWNLTLVNAGKGPVCSYRNTEDETVFLTYLPLLKKGEEYVDFGKDGKCLKRAICSETFKTEVEDCSKYPVTCANKQIYKGVFPGCCVKC